MVTGPFNNVGGGGFPRRLPFMPPAAQQPTPSSLREQVEQTVYRLERQQVFFDRNVAFCYNSYDSGWQPVSFNDLMAMAE